MPSGTSSLSSRIFFQPVHDRNVHCVQLLVNTVLPVAYSPDFFKKLAAASTAPAGPAGGAPGELAACAFFDDIFVGCVAARLEPERKAMYIMVLGVLAPYRTRGIGKAMLQRVLEAAESGRHGELREVWLHVHTGNGAAQAFYEAQGFTRSGEWKGYYRGIEPPDAYVYRRALGGARLEDLQAPVQGGGNASVESTR